MAQSKFSRMTVTEHIEQAQGNTLFSFEILPPKKGEDLQKVLKNIRPLIEMNPSFINVTYHREEHKYVKRKDGLLEKRTIKKRPGTIGLSAVIQNQFQIDCIPHVICGSFTKEDTENFLIDLDFIGIRSVMALRGDAIKNESTFIPEPRGNNYACDLVEQIQQLNNGNYVEDAVQGSHTNFEVGVAGYPEKHMEAPSMNQDIAYLKKKVDNGASYIVTQMFFDNSKYFSFVEQCRDAGIHVPIIPGLKPLTIKKHLTILPRIFNVDLPDKLVEAVQQCKRSKDVRKVGVEWGIQQAKELKEYGVPALHFFTMGKSGSTEKIVKEVF